MGYHYLNSDLVIQNVTNVTLTEESLCIIIKTHDSESRGQEEAAVRDE